MGTLNSNYGLILSNGMKIDVNYYPGFVRKALTFTIDDGNVAMDRAFLDIVRPMGIKGTFNLCSVSAMAAAEYLLLYEGYEVANHSEIHALPYRDGFDYSKIEIKDEVFDKNTADGAYMYKHSTIEGLYYIDYRQYTDAYTEAYWHPIATNETYTKYIDITEENIESVFGEGSVVGYAYPHGQLNEYVKQYLKDSGYLYARKTGRIGGKGGYDLPEDRFSWSYNADHTNLLSEMAAYAAYGDDGELKFFSFGVHSSDYKNYWDMLVEFAETYGARSEDFYYATNLEIFEYEDAIKALDINEERIVNNSSVMVYITVNNVKVKIPAGATLMLSDIEAENPECILTFDEMMAEGLPAPLTSSLNSTVANEIGLLLIAVENNKKLVLTTGDDGADSVAFKLMNKSTEYDAVTFSADVTLDSDSDTVGFTVHFKDRFGNVIYQLSMNGNTGKIGFSDYYKYNGAGVYTFGSEQGLTTHIMGEEFTLTLEMSKNADGAAVVRIFADEIPVCESSHAAWADTALCDVRSLEITSNKDCAGTLSFDNVSFKRTSRIENEKSDEYAEISSIKGGANGIVVLIHDDGDLATATLLDKLYEKYGTVGDVALIANRVWNTETASPILDKQAGWQAVFDTGRWGLINHSMTHAFWGESTSDALSIDKDMLYNEIVTSGEVLRTVFPSQRVLTFAYPGFSSVTNVHGTWCAYKDAVSLALRHYVGARNYSGASQMIDKLIHVYSNGRTLGGSASDYQQIDAAANEGKILVFLMHRVVESGASGTAINYDKARGVVEYVSDYVYDGKIWSAHFEDAMLYTKEASTARVSSSLSEGVFTLTVEDGLDDTVYNYPLTVKVRLPFECEAVKLTQGERVFYALVKSEGEEAYAYVDVVPNGEVATLVSVSAEDVPEEFVPKAKPTHEHTYSSEWTYDEENHWHKADCDERVACAAATTEYAPHVFDGDGVCECGYEKPEVKKNLGYFDYFGGHDFTGMDNVYNQLEKPLIIKRNMSCSSTSNQIKHETYTAAYLNFGTVDENTVLTLGVGAAVANSWISKGTPGFACYIPVGTGDCYVFESNVYFGPNNNVKNSYSALSVSFFDTDGGENALREIVTSLVKDDGTRTYECFGTEISPEAPVNIGIEYYASEGVVKYYLNGALVHTADVAATDSVMDYVRVSMNQYGDQYVSFDDMFFGRVGKHLSQSDEYYTFNDGNIPAGVGKYFKDGASALSVSEIPFLNTTEKVLTLTSVKSSYKKQIFFETEKNENATKAVFETNYFVQPAEGISQPIGYFSFANDNTQLWQVMIFFDDSGNLNVQDYIKGGSGHQSVKLALGSVRWINLKFEAYANESGEFVVDIYVNGAKQFTSSNTLWTSSSLADINRVRFDATEAFVGNVYFDDVKLEIE